MRESLSSRVKLNSSSGGLAVSLQDLQCPVDNATHYHCHEWRGGRDGRMDLFWWAEAKDQWAAASHLWFP